MKRILLALSIVSALVLTGCSKMDLAASVGDYEITLSSLQSKVDSILAERDKVDTSQMQLEAGEDLARTQLSFLIGNQIIEAVAKDQGIDITDSDVEVYRLQVVQNIGGEAMLPSVLVNASISPDGLSEVLRRDLIIQKLTETAKANGADDNGVNDFIQKLVTDKASSVKIEVNPRYGTWDATSFSIVASDPAGDAVTNE